MTDFDYGSKRPDGQHERHPGIPQAAQREKVRPVRDSYRHVGPRGPAFPLRDLTPNEQERYRDVGYVKFEAYPQEQNPKTGRFWTQAQLDAVGKGCGQVTRMPQHCAETYAVDPKFYGSTFCCGCHEYKPVAEFVWIDDGTAVGS
jgi:hypothetical protein